MTTPPPEPSHVEIQSLLGAYALDATDPEESAMVEQHLQTCVRCATEVAQHHEVAGLLANSGGEAPEHLWDGIGSHLEGTTPPSWNRLAARLDVGGSSSPAATAGAEGATAVLLSSARRRRLALAGGGLVAAAAVVVAIVLGIQVDHLHSQLNTTPALTRAEQAALAQPSTERVRLVSPSSSASPSKSVTVVLTRSGTGFVVADDLAALPAGRTYQLWGFIHGQTISLGLLGRAPAVVPFSAAGQGGPNAFAITAEHAGGAVQPTSTPVVEGDVRT